MTELELEDLQADVRRLVAERDEARLWARAYRELDTYRWWKGGTWGVDAENPPAWLLERLPKSPEEQAVEHGYEARMRAKYGPDWTYETGPQDPY